MIGGLIAFFLARGVSNPITALTQSMRGLAAGNFDVAKQLGSDVAAASAEELGPFAVDACANLRSDLRSA